MAFPHIALEYVTALVLYSSSRNCILKRIGPWHSGLDWQLQLIKQRPTSLLQSYTAQLWRITDLEAALRPGCVL